ncbi:MAG: tRNA (5-methylaminomethyl-2-thiouridine)(34)-methyltransferase MnmD [Bacteroidales bacterium]|nr:tRNA (5-methylaminomethyl-2-thiouridine)(34)-methyltransferase MnmD [Bacteroidales bacterium]
MELKITGDGSHTLFIPELNEHYHSHYGAVTESLHVFIGAGYDHVKTGKNQINILEIGFGTGLNAYLTWLSAVKDNVQIRYFALEPHPLPVVICSDLHFPPYTDSKESKKTFLLLHESPWEEWTPLDDFFALLKIQQTIQQYVSAGGFFDLVYFDAFGPDVQPDMWTAEVFKKMFAALKPGGTLVTYSTKGQVKRNLKEAGFGIEKLPGPFGKREILRAIKQ